MGLAGVSYVSRRHWMLIDGATTLNEHYIIQQYSRMEKKNWQQILENFNKKNAGGFRRIDKPYDGDISDTCNHPSHNPPMHIHLPPGRYEYTCPGCKKVTARFNIPDLTWEIKPDNYDTIAPLMDDLRRKWDDVRDDDKRWTIYTTKEWPKIKWDDTLTKDIARASVAAVIRRQI